jgi:hypothetical protein
MPIMLRVGVHGFAMVQASYSPIFIGKMALFGAAEWRFVPTSLPSAESWMEADSTGRFWTGKVAVLRGRSEKKPQRVGLLFSMLGGSGEIRTHERLTPSPVFKTGAFNHSATLPADRHYT